MNVGWSILHEGNDAYPRSQRSLIVCSVYDVHGKGPAWTMAGEEMDLRFPSALLVSIEKQHGSSHSFQAVQPDA